MFRIGPAPATLYVLPIPAIIYSCMRERCCIHLNNVIQGVRMVLMEAHLQHPEIARCQCHALAKARSGGVV